MANKKHHGNPGYHAEMIKWALSHSLHSNDSRVQDNLRDLTDLQRKSLLRAVSRKQSDKLKNPKLTEEEKEDFKEKMEAWRVAIKQGSDISEAASDDNVSYKSYISRPIGGKIS